MFYYGRGLLPVDFNDFFGKIRDAHSYDTRLASKIKSYALSLPRTNYGKFNIRLIGPKTWNSINDNLKILPLKTFKIKLKCHLLGVMADGY